MEVLIVDDHAFIHETLTAVVHKAVPKASVRAVSSLAEGIALARKSAPPELVLLDLGLPGCTGVEALARFCAALPKLRVAVISAIEDAACMRAAFAAGAVGYIPKTTTPPVMVAAVRLIAEGGSYVPPQLTAEPDEGVKLNLTGRQAAVLRLLVKGLGNQQIAKKLDISENTVKQHTHALYGALKVSSRTQAIVAAARLGIKSD